MTRSLAVLPLLAVLLASGCSSGPSPSGGDSDGGTLVRGGRPTGVPSYVPSPDTTQTERLLAGLAAINPDLTTSSTEYTVGVARNVCNVLTVVASPAPDREGASKFFVTISRANGVALTDAEADRAVEIVADTFCPIPEVGPS